MTLEKPYVLVLLMVLGAIAGALLLISDRLQAIADAIVRP